jgi:poly-gamma-glutamate capsule biosynthesis protein CapA/YwtB (metallophosphatase superfamily)
MQGKEDDVHGKRGYRGAVRRLGSLAAVSLAIACPAATGAQPAIVTISGTGDIAMAPSGSGAAGFFDSGIRKALAADISLGNLEGTLATGGSSKCGPDSSDCFAFRAPPSYSAALKRAGFTIMNLANNHALDFGEQGRSETIGALRRVGLRFTGRPGEIAVLRQGGTKVAFVGFAPYPWAQSLLDIEEAVDLVRKADRKADVVVVTMHAGAEGADQQHVRPGPEWFLGEPRGNVYAFSHAVVRAGADLVVGHGPHVLRGIEWYRGRVIAYSLGNFLGNGTLNVSGVTGQTAVLRASLRRDGSWVEGKLVPVQLTGGGLPRVDSGRAALATVRTLSRADFGRNAMRISPSGTLLPPAWRTG